ncbi:Nucleoporin nup84 [Coemansia sp. RSA 990]|nr:nuclear pore protein 84/107 [Coemansia mojavensis]KAJ1870935.1 Nucleoporin nup84 [Coemansia sp. RSA 990]
MALTEIASDFASVVEAQAQVNLGAEGDKSVSPALAYSQLAKQRCDELAASDAFGTEAERQRNKAQYWKSVSDTWNLLERLYMLRHQAQSDTAQNGASTPNSMFETDSPSALTTDFISVQNMMGTDALLAEYVEVRRWLEDTAPEFQPVETRKGYLFYTRRSIRDRKLFAKEGDSGSADTSRTVTEIDPDATSRQKKKLAFEDAEYNTGLLRTLYEYVRRGRVDNAMDLCVESDEPWRAASIKGGLFWRDPKLETDDNMPVDGVDGKDALAPSHPAGNINRVLWKHACAALAHDENNELFERALYAALSGRLDEVLMVCESWEDFVWAYVNSMIETRIERGLKDTNQLYIPEQATSFDHIQSKYPQVVDIGQVFDIIATHDSEALQNEANSPLRKLQAALITNRFAKYLQEFADSLDAEGITGDREELLQFVVHAALYMRRLGFELPGDAVDKVLNTYSSLLAQDHRELVSIYVSHMPVDKQTEAYAQFLYKLDGSRAVRMQLLDQAKRHGLDTAAISKRATELGLATSADGEMDTDNEQFILAEPAEPIAESELDKIRAIEWVTSSPQLYEYALVEICKLARQFLLHGRTNAATQLFNSLPSDFVQQEWISKAQGIANYGGANTEASRRSAGSMQADKTQATYFQEYIHMLSLCDAFAYYATWAETLCKRPANTQNQRTRLQMQWLEWKEAMAQATDHAVKMFQDRLLDIDWLSMQSLFIAPDGDQDSSDQRLTELERLRDLYIPEAVFRLHSILFDTRDALPKNLKRSLDLAQLVANDSLGIYRQLARATPEHPNGRLTAFMRLMRRSAYEILRVQQESQPDKPPVLADAVTVTSGIA